MKEYQWKVELLSPPPVVRHCKKCGTKTEYASAGLFRVNAQRKYLDIWLIYKCTQCDSTWNMTIYTRVNPQSLPRELLAGFHENARELAQKYAMDTGLVCQNGASPGQPCFRVRGDVPAPDTPARVRISGAYASGLKVAGAIQGPAGSNLEKCRLQGEISLLIHTGADGFRAQPEPAAALQPCPVRQEK